MAPARDWAGRRAEGAPARLRDRTLAYLADPAAAGVPEALGAAGLQALDATIRMSADRSAALDLLAADALVTLALQAQAEADPAHLASFARTLRDRAGRPA